MEDHEPAALPARGPLVPSIAFLVLVVLLAGTFIAASSSQSALPQVQQLLDVPDIPVTVVADPPAATQPPFTITTLVGPAVTLALSVPGSQAAQQLLTAVEAAGLDALEATAVRSTLTSVTPDGSLNPYVTLGLITDTGFYDVAGLSPDGNSLWYSPPLVQIPADLTVGSTWTSEGLTLDFAPFTFTGEVLGPPKLDEGVAGYDGRSGCVELQTLLEQEIPEAEGYTTERRTTWCPGLGSVLSQNLTDGVATRLALPLEADWPALTVPVVPKSRPAGTQLSFPIPVTAIARPPLSVSSGLLLVNGTLGDVVSVTVAAPSELGLPDTSTLLWMQHPGGTIVGTSVDDDDTFVTTSLRMLQAFDEAGRLRWSADLPDISSGTPVALGDVVAVALVDGSMRGYDRSTGSLAWVVRLSDVIAESPVRVGDLVVAADTSGYVAAVDAQGREAWSASVDPIDAPLSGLDDGSVLLAQTSGALALYDSTGSEVWSVTPPDSDFIAPASRWGEVIAVPSSGGLLGLSVDSGEVLWSLPELARSRVVPARLVATSDAVYRVDEDGTPSFISEVTEVDGSAPAQVFLAMLGQEWVAVTQQGAITFLGVGDE